MRVKERFCRSERGAVFVQVGISLFVLMSFNVFVLDYGVMWVGRRQAQNAADAGALAGATSRAYDAFVPGGATSYLVSAPSVAAANLIWQQSGTTQVTTTCPAGETGSCVQVNVYRNGVNGSTSLPTLFGPILGINSQGVQASATAVVGRANTTRCLKPWAMPDKFNDPRPPANQFNGYASGVPLVPKDTYTAPTSTLVTSTALSTDYGRIIRFNLNNALMDPITYPISIPATEAFMMPLALPGGKTHLQNMTTCNGQPIVIGQRLPIDTTVLGGGSGLTDSAAHANFDLDPGADYAFEAGGYVANSCAPNCPPDGALSPRLWAVALFDPDDFEKNRQTGWPDCGGSPCVLVTNITGFFIDYLNPTASLNGQHGHFLRYPGTTTLSQPTIIENGSWLVEPHLIR